MHAIERGPRTHGLRRAEGTAGGSLSRPGRARDDHGARRLGCHHTCDDFRRDRNRKGAREVVRRLAA